MKNGYMFLLLALAMAGLFFLDSCGKPNNDAQSCDGKFCAAAYAGFTIQLKDPQGRDLFNTATPAHYDTAVFNRLNTGVARVMQYPLNTGPFRIITGAKPGSTITLNLKLTDMDVDTVTYSQLMTSQSCCPVFKMTSFSYNGVSNTDSLSSAQFLVVKTAEIH